MSNYLWAILASVTWGLAYALDDKVLHTNSPVYIAIVNAIVALILFVPLAIFGNHGSLVELVRGKQFGLMLLSSVLVSVGGLFILYGIKNLGASMASIIEISYPFFVMLFMIILWRERITPSFFLGALLMLCGSVILVRSRG